MLTEKQWKRIKVDAKDYKKICKQTKFCFSEHIS